MPCYRRTLAITMDGEGNRSVLVSLLLVSEPEGVAVGHNVAHGRRREVGTADQHVSLAIPLQEGLAGLMCQGPVKIRAWYPGWLCALYRAVDHIASDDTVGAAGGQMHADVIRGMAWRGFQPHLVAESIVVGHEGGQPCFDNRQHAIGKVLQRRGLVHR